MMDEAHSRITQWAAPRREKLLWLAFVLLTLPHFNPGYINGYATQWEPLVNGGRVVSALVILVWLLLIKRRVSLIVLAIGMQQGYVVLNTMVHHGDVKDCFLGAVSVIAVVMLYDLMQDERRAFLSSQLFCFEVMIYINLLTVLLYPNGMYTSLVGDIVVREKHNYFLGYYNSYISYCLPALLIAFLYKKDTGRWLRPWLLTAACYLTALRTWSGAVLVALAGMLITYVGWKYLSKVLNYYSCWSLEIVFFVMVILLRLQNLLRWLIDNVLHKWNSLTGRMDVWNVSMARIREAWLFGYGQLEAAVRVAETGKSWGMHAHNQFLEILYIGGIINLLLFVWVVYTAGRRVYKHKDTLESKYITIAFLGRCLADMVDPHAGCFLVAMFVIAYYSNRDALQPGEKDPLDIPKWDEWLRAAPGRLRARFARR